MIGIPLPGAHLTSGFNTHSPEFRSRDSIGSFTQPSQGLEDAQARPAGKSDKVRLSVSNILRIVIRPFEGARNRVFTVILAVMRSQPTPVQAVFNRS